MKFYNVTAVAIFFFHVKKILGISINNTVIKPRGILKNKDVRKKGNHDLTNAEHVEYQIEYKSPTETKKTKNSLKSRIINLGKGIKTNVTNLFKPQKKNIIEHPNLNLFRDRPLPPSPSSYYYRKPIPYSHLTPRYNYEDLWTQSILSEPVHYERRVIDKLPKPNYVNWTPDNISSDSTYYELIPVNNLPKPAYANSTLDGKLPESIYDELPVANKLPKLTCIDLQNHMSSKQGIGKTLEESIHDEFSKLPKLPEFSDNSTRGIDNSLSCIVKPLTTSDASPEESRSTLNIPDENDGRKMTSQVASQIQDNSPVLEEDQPIHNKKTTSEMESTLEQNTPHHFPFARNHTERINRKKLEEEVKDIDLTYEHHPEEKPRIIQYKGPCMLENDVQILRPGLAY